MLSSASWAARAKSLTWSGTRSPTTRRILGRSSSVGSNTPPPCPGNMNALIFSPASISPYVFVDPHPALQRGVERAFYHKTDSFNSTLTAFGPPPAALRLLRLRCHDAQSPMQHPRPEDARRLEGLAVDVSRDLLRQIYPDLPRPRQMHLGVRQERASQ